MNPLQKHPPSRGRFGALAFVALTALGSALMLAGVDSHAQATQPGGASAQAASTGQALHRDDRRFIEMAARGGMAEVALGRIAEQRASDPEVRQFGTRMVQDHGRANEELLALARARQIVPPDLDAEHQRTVERLSRLQGAEFDRSYVQHMVQDHKKDVASFRKASQSARDEELKAFPARTLPTLENHLTMAEATHQRLKGGR